MLTKSNNIDEYIAYFPTDVQMILDLILFAAFKNPIGLYPTPNGIDTFQNKFSEYKAAKGSIQFL